MQCGDSLRSFFYSNIFMFYVLFILFPLSMLGQGIHSISILAFLYLVALSFIPTFWISTAITITKQSTFATHVTRYVFCWIVLSFSTFTAFYSIFGTTGVVGYFMVLGASFIHALLIIIFIIFPMVEIHRKFPQFTLNYLLFPIFLTGYSIFLATMVPGGSLFQIAYPISIGIVPLRSFAGLFGIDGIHFFIGYIAAITGEIIARSLYIHRSGIKSADCDENKESSNQSTKWLRISLILSILFVFTYGGANRITMYDQFFQNSVSQYNIQGYINYSCFIGSVLNRVDDEGAVKEDDIITMNDILGDQTEQQLKNQGAADIALWSEGYTVVYTDYQENKLLHRCSKLANSTKVVFGASYIRIYPNSNNTQNIRYNITTRRSSKLACKPCFHFLNLMSFFVLIKFAILIIIAFLPNIVFQPDGQLSWIYQKSNLVPGIEESILLPSTTGTFKHVNFGERYQRIGALIGWDYINSDFVRTASSRLAYKNDVPDIMLAPSWEWSSVGIFLDQIVSFRAIENGFTILKCSSGGVSSVYDAYGNTIYRKVTTETNSGFTVQVPRIKRELTPFAIAGEFLGWLCFSFTMIGMIIALLPDDTLYFIFSWLTPYLESIKNYFTKSSQTKRKEQSSGSI